MSTHTLHCAIISPQPEVIEIYSQELERSPSIHQVECLTDYPDDEALARLLRLNQVDLVILDCSVLERAMEIIKPIRAKSPHTEIVAHCQEDVKMLATLMRMGVGEYIPVDASVRAVRDSLAELIERVREKPQPKRTGGDFAVFLPSKPGSGASTIAANAAIHASKAEDKNVLLMDMDRDSPVQAFLHRIQPEYYLHSALASSHQMEGELWARLVSRHGKLDVLPSDPDGPPAIENGRTQELLRFVRRAYDLTCFDLPGQLDPPSVEVLLEAKRVFLVCTQELASVHIALKKAERLRRLGLSKELSLIINRYSTSNVMTDERVADIVGLPVSFALPNSYTLASASAEKGSGVDPDTPLGRSYAQIAKLLLNNRIEVPQTKRKFLEFFYRPFDRPQSKTA